LFGTSNDEHDYGQGKVFASGSLAEAFAALRLPDFAYPEADDEVLYSYRRLDDGDLYFVDNRQQRAQEIAATFRVAGYAPKIWGPVSGETKPATFRTEDGRTTVPLALAPNGTAFVVFRKKTQASSRALHSSAVTTLQILKGPWTVAFQPHRGAPTRMTVRKLQSWSDSTVDGVKYFSGTGTYTKAFELPALNRKRHLILDLGQVWELARVTLNGKPLGIVWTEPFRFDISKAARTGRNLLKIEVTNLWVNRLIGDAQAGARVKYIFTTIPTYLPDVSLRESGLLGPVQILQAATGD
jgi:hypothetical protein